MSDERQFRVLSEDRRATPKPHSVPWEWLAQFEARIQRTHSQTLERLEERGGMGWHEILGASRDLGYQGVLDLVHSLSMPEAQTHVLKAVAEWRASR